MSDEEYEAYDENDADAHWAMVDKLRRDIALPTCQECGRAAHPETATMVFMTPPEATWVVPGRFHGVYCKADCALNAYLRGYGQYKAMTPDHSN